MRAQNEWFKLSDMKCPTDNIDLEEKQSDDGFAYHECPDCAGLWMRFRSLKTLVEKHNPGAVNALPHPERLIPGIHRKGFDTNNITNCPLDGADYYEHRYGSVLIDICPNCDGIWLDHGEIDKIKEELKNKSIPDDKLEVVLSDFGIGAIADYLIELFSSAPQDDEEKPKD